MNATPSRWCGLSQRVSMGSTMMRARGEEEVVANVEATPLPPPSTAAFSGSSHRHRGSPGGGPSSPLSPTVEIATLGTGSAGTVEALNAAYDADHALERFGRRLVEEAMSGSQRRTASFLQLSPEERYTRFVATRPEIFRRVPQFLTASYLGITPEALSRIRGRRRKPGDEPL